MRLWIIRHADAVDGLDDSARALSLKGRRQAEVLGAVLGRLRLGPPDEIWHSPLVRARETAEIAKAAAGLLCPLAPMEGLLPYDQPDLVMQRLVQGRHVAIVGHNPHLARLVSWLIAGDGEAGAFHVRKATAIGLEQTIHTEGGAGPFRRWSVEWMLPPDLISAQAGS